MKAVKKIAKDEKELPGTRIFSPRARQEYASECRRNNLFAEKIDPDLWSFNVRDFGPFDAYASHQS